MSFYLIHSKSNNVDNNGILIILSDRRLDALYEQNIMIKTFLIVST